MALENITGTVTKAYPSKPNKAGDGVTPHNIYLGDSIKVTMWPSKFELTDEQVHYMIGRTYLFTVQEGTPFGDIKQYVAELFEERGVQAVVQSDGNGGEVEGASSPAPRPLTDSERINLTSAAYMAKDIMIASGVTVETFQIDVFYSLVSNIVSIIKGEYVPPEPIDVIDYEEGQGLFPDVDNNTPF
jgi:hypothetical protein